MTRQSIWITADQAADLLSVSTTTIYRMMQAAIAMGDQSGKIDGKPTKVRHP